MKGERGIFSPLSKASKNPEWLVHVWSWTKLTAAVFDLHAAISGTCVCCGTYVSRPLHQAPSTNMQCLLGSVSFFTVVVYQLQHIACQNQTKRALPPLDFCSPFSKAAADPAMGPSLSLQNVTLSSGTSLGQNVQCCAVHLKFIMQVLASQIIFIVIVCVHACACVLFVRLDHPPLNNGQGHRMVKYE
jgi:hypothetical protein